MGYNIYGVLFPYKEFFPKSKKIGVINWWWLSEEESNLDLLESFIQKQDATIFIVEEIFLKGPKFSYIQSHIFDLLKEYNIYYLFFSNERDIFNNFPKDKSIFFPYFTKINISRETDFEDDIEYRDKKYIFNMLCGRKKPYRDILYNIIKYKENIYSTYFGDVIAKMTSDTHLEDVDILHYLINQDVKNGILQTGGNAYIEKYSNMLSHIIPSNIYKNSHFDIVCETLIHRDKFFYTEKIAKPLSTGRYFCVFSCPFYLNVLQNTYGFSFNTYHTKYDMVHDDIDRLALLCEHIFDVCGDISNVKNIYKSTKEERLYNQELYFKYKKEFSTKIIDWLNEIK